MKYFESFGKEPLQEFEKWFEKVVNSKEHLLPEAMTLATVKKNGRPSARVVLLKGVSRGGLLFFTNYDSPKAQDLKARPYGALVFHWERLKLQVRVEGKVSKVTKKESEEYFKTRPRESQIGAWASSQSAVVASRQSLEEKFESFKKKFEGQEVPLPKNWGGYRLIPDRFEFWTHGDHRLHDRLIYRKAGSKWKKELLSP